IANGEKLSDVINFKPQNQEHLIRCMAGYTLGDAGTAILIGESDSKNIIFQELYCNGSYWDLCVVEGGGSLAFRDSEKYYFECQSKELKAAIIKHCIPFIKSALMKSRWQNSEVDWLITHQVSNSTSSSLATFLNIADSKCLNYFPLYGNTAAASIPLSLYQAIKDRKIKKGDKLLIIGLAAGISASVHCIIW
ncbi:MAG: 3-oxoacyl-[acyl-carrier-protein] synthase III C-terminal domain-containing protein, partial [Saprospiraceae bacterium]